MECLRVRIRGRVQGVFFRAWTRERALELGLNGWVGNCSDGSVEAYVQGEEKAVEELICRMRRGPPTARVDELMIDVVDSQRVEGFSISA